MTKCIKCDHRYMGPEVEPPPQWACESEGCDCSCWAGDIQGMGRTLAIDFDGVIHRYSKGWQDGSIYDPPIEGAILGMKKLQHMGWHLVILTARANLTELKEWMIIWWPTEACMQPDSVEVCNGMGAPILHYTSLGGYRRLRLCNAHPIPQATNQKPGAFAYIDDRAFKFESWGGVLNEFTKP